jgi:predicted TIM-barrel fold metal-dependent hydrolase
MVAPSRLISADSHVNEAPDLWESRLPNRLRRRGPRLVETEDGRDVWVTEGLAPMPLMWATNAAGQRAPDAPFADHEMVIARHDMVRGSYDAPARLEAMDADGLHAEVLYPGPLAGLGGGGGIAAIPDPELRQACIGAYNDWLVEFCSFAPERLIGLALIRIEEPAAAATELERAASLGLRGAVINAMPDVTGAEPLFSPAYDAVWSAAEATRMPLSLHIGHCRSLGPLTAPSSRSAAGSRSGRDSRSRRDARSADDARFGKDARSGRDARSADDAADGNPLTQAGSGSGLAEMFFTMMCLDMAEPLTLLIYSGALERHPRLRFVIAESGIGWIPFVLERMDYTFKRHRLWMKSGIPDEPSSYFRRGFHATFQQDDEAGLLARYITGVDNLMWASDYPHTDSTWPFSRKVVEELFKGIPSDERDRITAGNAARLYHLDG